VTARLKFPTLITSYLSIAAIGISLIGVVAYGFHQGNRITATYAPLIDAAMDIKLEATEAHLWFEDILHGDRQKSMQTVWNHLSEADWYAKAMLEGGVNDEGTFVPLEDVGLRLKIEDLQKKLRQFTITTQQRYKNKESSTAGTDIDQRYDTIYREFINIADDVEVGLYQAMTRDVSHFKTIQGVVFLICILLILFMVLLFRRIEVFQREELSSRFGRILEDSFNEIYIFSAKTLRFVQVNAGARKNLGYTLNELAQLSPVDLKPEYSLASFEALLEPLRSGEKSMMNFETVHQRKNGSLYNVDIRLQLSYAEAEPLFVAIIKDITEQKKAEQELIDSHKQLRELCSHLENIREEERTRIAREVHDELGQKLTALNYDLSGLKKGVHSDKESFLEKVHSMSKLVSSTLASVQKICTELRPEVLDVLGLSEAIEWQAQEFLKKTGVGYEIDLNPEEITLDADRSTAVFRIFQETLTNVARHADANKVQIRMEKNATAFFLEVQDDGKGFNADEADKIKSLGLIGMQERALLWGGEVGFSGAQGKGTTVKLTIPLGEQ